MHRSARYGKRHRLVDAMDVFSAEWVIGSILRSAAVIAVVALASQLARVFAEGIVVGEAALAVALAVAVAPLLLSGTYLAVGVYLIVLAAAASERSRGAARFIALALSPIVAVGPWLLTNSEREPAALMLALAIGAGVGLVVERPPSDGSRRQTVVGTAVAAIVFTPLSVLLSAVLLFVLMLVAAGVAHVL